MVDVDTGNDPREEYTEYQLSEGKQLPVVGDSLRRVLCSPRHNGDNTTTNVKLLVTRRLDIGGDEVQI